MKENPYFLINKLHKKYGPVFTIYLGTQPIVIIGDYCLAKVAFNSFSLIGRPSPKLSKIIETALEGGSDVIFTDDKSKWKALRKAAHSAIRYFEVNLSCQN